MGTNGTHGLVQMFGYQEALSLDSRGRFRLPDEFADALHRALGRAEAQGHPWGPSAAFERLAFYFVPGPAERIFLYPAINIRLAIERFEAPPAGLDAEAIRHARNYLYEHMRFVEADKQNRLLIPERLRAHANIGREVEQITLVAHNYWLVLARSELVEQLTAARLEAFEKAAPELLDPAYRTPPEPDESDPTKPLP